MAVIPFPCRAPDDPLRALRGVLVGLVLVAPFWLAVAVFVVVIWRAR